MKSFAEWFYRSEQWKKTRRAYLTSVGGLCEECLKEGRITPAKIVHHKIFLTPENIHDPDVALNWNNLEAVCKPCHEQIHEYCGKKNDKRYEVDELGRII